MATSKQGEPFHFMHSTVLVAMACMMAFCAATNDADHNMKWLNLRTNVQCGMGVIPGEQFDDEGSAMARCEELENCYGVYNVFCDGTAFFLCHEDFVQTPQDLSYSEDGSCVREMLLPEGMEPEPAATPVPPPRSISDSVECAWTCSLSNQSAPVTCEEQILGFVTESTGSMPLTTLTCEQKRQLVSHRGDCQICAGCDACKEASTEPSNLNEVHEPLEHEALSTRSAVYTRTWFLAASPTLALAALLVALRFKFACSKEPRQPLRPIDPEAVE